MLRATRGMTLIEVVLAVTLMAMAAAAVFTAVSFVFTNQARNSHRLMCAELSHRLILQYLDDASAMPAQSQSIDYGGRMFRWEVSDEAVRAEPVVRVEQRSGQQLGIDNLRIITVRVWLSEETGGAARPDGSVPEYTISRIMDPMPVMRNPEWFARMVGTEDGRRRMLERMMGTRQAPPPGRAGNPKQPTPPPGGKDGAR